MRRASAAARSSIVRTRGMQHPHHSIRLLLLCAVALALAALALLPFAAHAQSISGVVNNYAKVVAIDACRNTLQVVDTAGFSRGDRVLIIQMAGATIDQSNSKSYGSVLKTGGAGTYEIAEIYDIPNAITIRLKNQLLKSYDADGLVQILRIPQYTNATVTGRLRPEPWDAGSGTGGVLVLEVSGRQS